MDPITPEVKAPAAPAVVENPHLENLNVPVAPGGDNELDDALNAVFKREPKNEEKPIEKTKESQKQPEKSESKEDKKPEPVKQEGELPTPESLDNEVPKNQKSWTALKNNYRQAASIIKQKEEELKKIKAGLAEKSELSSKEVETLKKEVQELSKYRTLIDIQADPEFISKYDQPINKIQDSIKELLSNMSVDKATVDQIDFTNTKLMDQIIDHVGTHQDKITSKKLQRKVEEMIDLMDKRDETLSGQKSSYQEFMDNKKKESSMKGAEEEGRILKRLAVQAEARDEAGNAKIPFLQKFQPKDGSSQAEIDQANKHNRMVDLMAQEVQKAITASSPEERTDIAIAAVGSRWLRAQLNTASNKIKSLEEELKKISNVSGESTPSKGRPGAAKGAASLDVDDALSAHFNR